MDAPFLQFWIQSKFASESALSEIYLKQGDEIYDTKDSVSFTDLLGKVVFSGDKK